MADVQRQRQRRRFNRPTLPSKARGWINCLAVCGVVSVLVTAAAFFLYLPYLLPAVVRVLARLWVLRSGIMWTLLAGGVVYVTVKAAVVARRPGYAVLHGPNAVPPLLLLAAVAVLAAAVLLGRASATWEPPPFEYDPAASAQPEPPALLPTWLAMLELTHKVGAFAKAGIKRVETLDRQGAVGVSDSAWAQVGLEEKHKASINIVLDARRQTRLILESFPDQLKAEIIHRVQTQTLEQKRAPSSFLVVMLLFGCFAWYALQVETLYRRGRHRRNGWHESIMGHFLDPQMSQIEVDASPAVVGTLQCLVLHHVLSNGLNHTCDDSVDQFRTVIAGPARVPTEVVVDGATRTVSFTVRKSGAYLITVTLFGEHVSGSPFSWQFDPTEIDPNKCTIQPSLLTVVAGSATQIKVKARDRFGNHVPTAHGRFGLAFQDSATHNSSDTIGVAVAAAVASSSISGGGSERRGGPVRRRSSMADSGWQPSGSLGSNGPTLPTIVEATSDGCLLHFQGPRQGVHRGILVIATGHGSSSSGGGSGRNEAFVSRSSSAPGWFGTSDHEIDRRGKTSDSSNNGGYSEWHALSRQPLIVLSVSEEAMKEINHNVHNRSCMYEAKQYDPTSKGGSGGSKVVQIHLHPAQIYVKSTWLRLFSFKTYSMRIAPASQFLLDDPMNSRQRSPTQVSNSSNRSSSSGGGVSGGRVAAGTSDATKPLVFTLDDRCGNPVRLSSPHRDIIFATYCRFLLNRIGGSDSFAQKQVIFNERLQAEHGVGNQAYSSRSFVDIKLRRLPPKDFVEEVYQKTKRLSDADWKRRWKVRFQDEPGVDYGGISRELFEMLGRDLFSPETGLFVSLDESSQGLVHPTQTLPLHLQMDHFKFAGRMVGKALFESATGNAVYLPARFTRSFLAALLGLRVDHSFFETDDPELFARKVQYVLANSVKDLDLTFSDHVNDSLDGKVKQVELKPGGSLLGVTDENKLEYLNLLAAHRLTDSVADATKQFVKGLSELVPDTLLSLFDENELELLICGVSDFDVALMKRHCSIGGLAVLPDNGLFVQTLEWFWLTVEAFTEEERIKLLRFVTGSGALPSNGFAGLTPHLNIGYAEMHNALPSSHTCFNQLCLPTYDTLHGLQQALSTAIEEGAEGFYGGV